MNTRKDILKIIGDLETVAMYVTTKEEGNLKPEKLKEAYINASNKVAQAERELKALNLSRGDSKHLSWVRDGLKLTRKALIAASEGKGSLAKIFMSQANTKIAEYSLRKIKSNRKSPNG
ncbi:hypothetical protein KD050_18855 [Psychrobacillus sp. INOP01]|uniref:hypothetical protein n=1 Tax=Psychrobacillus sp. INOP01 TaxID=2829187 RepID=UPI001BA72E9A|nr:hypothetical protein [Psychrobacillus sp. INOP01]QUG41310.1 hypothetical protein KD050_18855 [Psychrobacillus sp. INOP01]